MAWSDAARKAALEARRAHAKGKQGWPEESWATHKRRMASLGHGSSKAKTHVNPISGRRSVVSNTTKADVHRVVKKLGRGFLVKKGR